MPTREAAGLEDGKAIKIIEEYDLPDEDKANESMRTHTGFSKVPFELRKKKGDNGKWTVTAKYPV
ncbi:MAG: hypothetical protein SFV19_13560 [Rhodospirillaceae bacterium]|nr:hypothetical protein [Rhodospirillaceae bacterium]